MPDDRSRGLTLILLTLLALSGPVGCTHALRIRNADAYATTLHLGTHVETKPSIAIAPFEGSPDSLWFFNAIVERLAMDPAIGELRTDYVPRLGERAGIRPDLIVSIDPTVDYHTSGWNFLINWPGFLIFTPAWNGYVYRADVNTNVSILDQDGTRLDGVDVPMTYDLRHADMHRTIWTGLTWLEVSALAFFGGIYNANVFDPDVVDPFQTQVKDNYANFVLSRVQARIQSIAASLDRPVDQITREPDATPEAESPSEDPQDEEPVR
ncbi:MAG: hypothetical protein ACQGVC_16435 [Myxococcota bacterium]